MIFRWKPIHQCLGVIRLNWQPNTMRCEQIASREGKKKRICIAESTPINWAINFVKANAPFVQFELVFFIFFYHKNLSTPPAPTHISYSSSKNYSNNEKNWFAFFFLHSSAFSIPIRILVKVIYIKLTFLTWPLSNCLRCFPIDGTLQYVQMNRSVQCSSSGFT